MADRHDFDGLVQAILRLNAWERAAKHNWALVPQTSENPVIATVQHETKGAPRERLMLFDGFPPFRDFLVSRQMPDFGVGVSPADFPHFELFSSPRESFAGPLMLAPGFVPRPPDEAERAFYAPLLYECLGVMMRLEETPDLPLEYAKQNAMFARKELTETMWIDGPLNLPGDKAFPYTEQIALEKTKCAAGAKLPYYPEEVWELDFVMLPMYQTREERPRILYVLAAVDAASGERRVWAKMSVDGKPDGLKRLWENHATRVLDRVLALGRVPGAIHVRSGRMARFLRPLGLHLPFKLVQHAKLPRLDAVLDAAVKSNQV